jgi:hypothetical protein
LLFVTVLLSAGGVRASSVTVNNPTPPSLKDRLGNLYRHVLWWWHGVPWALCGLQDT